MYIYIYYFVFLFIICQNEQNVNFVSLTNERRIARVCFVGADKHFGLLERTKRPEARMCPFGGQSSALDPPTLGRAKLNFLCCRNLGESRAS